MLAAYLLWRLLLLPLIMTHVDDLGPVVDLVLREGSSWPRRVLGAWRQWSYAPLQYFITDPLTRYVSDPQTLLFMGRLGAFLPWFAGWGLVVWILLKPRAAGWAMWPLPECVLPLAWILISGRGIIESSQGYTYGATLLAAAGLCWLGCGTIGERLRQSLKGGVILGAALAAAVALSYQAIFLGAAAWIVIAFEAARHRERRAIAPLLAAGLLFGAAALLFYVIHLKNYAALSRFPSWAASGYPPLDWGWAAAPVFLVQAWPAVLQNLVSIGPWGFSGNVLGLFALMLAMVGLATAAIRGTLDPVERRLALFGGLLVLIWSAGALAGRFPLSPTRHTYILQAPFLLIVAAGIRHLRLPRPVAWGLPLVLGAIWLWWLPTLLDNIRNRVDLAQIELALDANPAAAIASAPGDYTWDHMLLLRSRPDLKSRLFREEFPDLLAGRPQRFDELLLVSHRRNLEPSAHEALASAGFTQIVSLAAVPAVGSTELSGNLNGGNGFYLTLCRRQEISQDTR